MKRDLAGGTTLHGHHPNILVPASVGPKNNLPAIRRPVRCIVGSLVRREPCHRAAFAGKDPEILVSAAIGTDDEALSVRRDIDVLRVGIFESQLLSICPSRLPIGEDGHAPDVGHRPAKQVRETFSVERQVR